jgi:hypothetical protein
MSQQTDAVRLADELIALHGYPLSRQAAAELRRLDAESAQLREQNTMLDEACATLEAVNAQLREQNTMLAGGAK